MSVHVSYLYTCFLAVNKIERKREAYLVLFCLDFQQQRNAKLQPEQLGTLQHQLQLGHLQKLLQLGHLQQLLQHDQLQQPLQLGQLQQ